MAGVGKSKMHMHTTTRRKWLRTDLLQGNDVAFVQVQLGCTELFLLIADHLLVQHDFIILPRQHPLYVGRKNNAGTMTVSILQQRVKLYMKENTREESTFLIRSDDLQNWIFGLKESNDVSRKLKLCLEQIQGESRMEIRNTGLDILMFFPLIVANYWLVIAIQAHSFLFLSQSGFSVSRLKENQRH